MYHHHNDFEAWSQHRHEVLREAGERRLARQLPAARSREKSPEIRRATRIRSRAASIEQEDGGLLTPVLPLGQWRGQ
jgi:hypothetical protein